MRQAWNWQREGFNIIRLAFEAFGAVRSGPCNENFPFKFPFLTKNPGVYLTAFLGVEGGGCFNETPGNSGKRVVAGVESNV